MVNALKSLREEGRMIITPNYYVSYNPFTDTFIVDVPKDKKRIWLAHPTSEQNYDWNAEGYYPAEIDANQDYEKAWKEIEQYIDGATIDMLPTFTQNGKEYVWFNNVDDGEEAVLKDSITIVKD